MLNSTTAKEIDLSSGPATNSVHPPQQNPSENHQWTKHEEWSNNVAPNDAGYPSEPGFMQSQYLAGKNYWS